MAAVVRDANDVIAVSVLDVPVQQFGSVAVQVLASTGFVPTVFERIDGF